MQALNLPDFKCDLRRMAENTTIFDTIRKKHVILTPEEWVRQHFVNYLVNHLFYPKSLIKLEGGLSFNSLKKRSDILVYDREGKPFMLVECKASHIKIEQKVFVQASVYNKTIKAKYIVVSNGMQHFCCEIDQDSNSYEFLQEIPTYG